VLDDQLLELLDLVAFETAVLAHDTILAEIVHRSSFALRDRKKGVRPPSVGVIRLPEVSVPRHGQRGHLGTRWTHLYSGLVNFRHHGNLFVADRAPSTSEPDDARLNLSPTARISANKSSSATSSVLMRFSSSLGFLLGARFAIFLSRYASAAAPDTQSNASDVDRSCSVDEWGTSTCREGSEAMSCRYRERSSLR